MLNLKSLLNNKKLINNGLKVWSAVGFYRGVRFYLDDVENSNKWIKERNETNKKYSESLKKPFQEEQLYKPYITIGSLVGACGSIFYYNMFLIPFTISYELYNLEKNIRKIK
jgi:hypothetical protein